MAPTRKSKSVNKRFINEASPDVDLGNSTKTKRKRKLADKLGPRWTRGELERFYDAYRKHRGDWRKVAAAVRNNRSVDMVEAVFNMNRAYLSLPEGTASVVGLIAMMTDHYNTMEGSESEGEGRDASEVPSKHQKRKRAKLQYCDSVEEVIPPHSIASAEGCLSTLRHIPAFVYERRATGIRTPRVPIIFTNRRDDREGSTPPNKRIKKQLNAEVDVALALADESRGGSPYRRTELNDSMPVRLGNMSQAKEAQSKHCNSSMFENGVRISRTKPQPGTVDVEASRGKYSLGTPKKRNKKLVFGDEFEALQGLAALSVSLPPTGLMESESSAQLKEERRANNMDEKSNNPETTSTSHHRENGKQAEPEDSNPHATLAADNRISKSAQASVDGDPVFIGDLGTSKRKRKPKVLGVEAPTNAIQNKSLCSKELAEGDSLRTVIKVRRAGQGPAKQLKTAEESSSTSDKKRTGPDAVVSATQVSSSDIASLPQKFPNRRKMGLKKRLEERAKSSETTHDKPHNYESLPEHELLKEASTCLSYPLVRRRCIFEWFYSAIDYPWFSKMEFIDYLTHVGLGHVPRLTRLEWSVIKSSLGRPRRFSERFLEEERDKLKQYRESVRKHYTELRAGAREGLPTDLAQPLSVGNRVIAIHPKTREIRDGKILTVDHDKCNVLFDELGVELVMDIDCMPLNPLEYMPEGLRGQIDSNEVQLNRHPNSHASILFSPTVLENASFSMNPPMKQSLQDDMDGSILHGKVLATNTTDQSYITTNIKARRGALVLQHTSDEKEMEPEMLGIVTGSKSTAQAMVDAAVKAASSAKKDEDARKMIQQALSSISEHQSMVPGIKQQEHSNGSLDDHHQSQSPSNTAEPTSNGLISQDGSGKNERQMPSELITSCVATWLMIQMCTEKQYPPGDVADVMERAVISLQPRCPQNMPIYRDIQTCMGWIKTQIMALVRT